jgi:DNA-binding transcriptional regulator YiaG
MKSLSATRRARVDARATALIAEEMSLRDLRRAHELTQERLSEVLGIGQESVSQPGEATGFAAVYSARLYQSDGR